MTENPLRDDGGLQSRGRAVEGETKGEYDAGTVDVRRTKVDELSDRVSVLQHVSEELRGDADVVLEAVKRDGREFEHASPALRQDKAFVMKALQHHSTIAPSAHAAKGGVKKAVDGRMAGGAIELILSEKDMAEDNEMEV